MLFKLAVRNVRRQLGNYLIYFITVALTVALMFAVDHLIFGKQMIRYQDASDLMRKGLVFLVVMIALIVAFVLSYATSFMLRLRKREFGTYLTLGMTRKDILKLFVGENILICMAALGAGMVFGVFLYQGIMALMLHMMEMEFEVQPYSTKGMAFTVAIVCGVFLVSSLLSVKYLKKVSIYELMHVKRQEVKNAKHPYLWWVFTVASFFAIVGSIVFFDIRMRESLKRGTGDSIEIILLMVMMVGIILFHIGLAHSLMIVLLGRKKLCSRGTNTFLLRQLGTSLHTNAVMIGLLAFLLAFTVVACNLIFLERTASGEQIKEYCPYDMRYDAGGENVNQDRSRRIPLDEAKRIIEKYVAIENTIPYTVYTNGGRALYEHTIWSGDGYEGLTDSYMTLSDFNALITPLGYDALQLKDSYLIVARMVPVTNVEWEDVKLSLNGKEYEFAGISMDYPEFIFQYFWAVVPDEAVSGMEAQAYYEVYDLAGKDFDAQALSEELSYPVVYQWAMGGTERMRSDFLIRECERRDNNERVAVLVIGCLFVAVIFICMAMAMLALKTLSGLSQDKERYLILSRVGVGKRSLKRTLFRQILIFFMFPFLLPLACSIPTAVIFRDILILNNCFSAASLAYPVAAAVAAVLLAIYLLYYTASYLIAKRVVIENLS